MSNAVAFDFERKTMDVLRLDEVSGAIASGHYCWIDFDDVETAAKLLPDLGIDDDSVARVRMDQGHAQTRHAETCIHCVLSEAETDGDKLSLNTVHVLSAHNLIATVHSRPSALIDGVRNTFEHDFTTTAESGGFLLFELADHLINGYRETLTALTERVDAIQRRLLGDVGDEILPQVSRLIRALLEYRNAIVAARETLDELATRRSAFVPASTQPFLDRQTVPLDRLAHDAATERTVLSEVLNLYMGIVGHRTGRVVNRLTVVSMILLPLNFLAAVFGAQWVQPEQDLRFTTLYKTSVGSTVSHK